MKYLKMLGLAAVAAMALAAFGAGTASATQLTSGTGGTPLPKGTVISASLQPGTSAILEAGGFVEDTCTASTVTGTISNPGGASATVSGSVAKNGLTFGNCIYPTTVEAGGTLEIHSSGGGKGTLTGKGFEVLIHGPSGTCTYGAGEGTHLGTLDPAPSATGHATMTINANVPRVGGVFCPSEAVWNATYTVTSPTGLTVD
jgi:hypothetical protein